MKKRVYWLTYYLSLEEKVLIVEINDKAGKCVHRTRFSRSEMQEQVLDFQFYLAVSNPNQIVVQMYSQRLCEEDKNCIHKIFPYIPKFTNLKEFIFWYKRCNVSFSYERYEYLETCMHYMLHTSKFEPDGIWKCMGFPQDNYLYCKWKDSNEKEHMVIVDEQMFVSDLDYEKICEAEKEFSLTESSNIQLFIEMHSKTLLDMYLNKGGRRVFSFLTAPKINHPMELLGKAGLVKLADNIERLEEINYAGNNFLSIFGVPLMVLKSLENGEEELLYTKEDRNILAKAFQENRAVFAEPMTEVSQMWLRYYYLNQGTLFAIKEGAKMPGNLAATIRYLNHICSENDNVYTVFGLYQNYLAYGQRIGKFVDGIYPKNLEKAVIQEIDILQKRYEAEKVRMFLNIVDRPDYKYLEEELDECKYKIKTPKRPEELVEAGESLHNCLSSYVRKVKKGLSKIAFLYENDRLIGAIEVKENQVKQALGSCNSRLPKEALMYLKGYMERKQLKNDIIYRGWGM